MKTFKFPEEDDHPVKPTKPGGGDDSEQDNDD